MLLTGAGKFRHDPAAERADAHSERAGDEAERWNPRRTDTHVDDLEYAGSQHPMNHSQMP